MKEEHKHKNEAGADSGFEEKQEIKTGENILLKEENLSEKELREALKNAREENKHLAGELARSKAASHENKDKALRALAEQNNAAKRQQKEKEEFIKYASGEVVRKIIPVLDDFESALKEKVSAQDNFFKGVKLIYGNLKETLEKEGLKKQETVGRVFDPNLHEVVATEPTEDLKKENVVAEEFRPGYMFKEFVLRPAMVKVFKKTEEDKKAKEEDITDPEKTNKKEQDR